MRTSGRSRKAWTAEQKTAIVREAMSGDVTVVGTARKYGISTVSIYSWRKDLEEGRIGAGRSPESAVVERRGGGETELVDADSGGDAAGEPVHASADGSHDLGDLSRELASIKERLGRIEARQTAFEENRAALRDVLRAIGSQLQLLARLGEIGFPSAPAQPAGPLGLSPD